MSKIILHPCHKNYCKECIYYNNTDGSCSNEGYKKNSYECVLRFCKYKKKGVKSENEN